MLCFALRKVSLSEVRTAFSNVDPLWLPILILLPLFDLWLRAVRWRILLARLVDGSVRKLFQLEAVGLAINNVLLLRVGELARAYVGGKELGVPTAGVFATIVIERLCDTAALLFILGLSASRLPGALAPRVRVLAFLGTVALVAALAALSALDLLLRRASRLQRALDRHPRFSRVVSEAMQGARALHSPSAILRVSALSLGLWLCDAGLYWATAQAMGLSPELSFAQSVVVLASAGASSALPMVPGSWGGFEAAVQAILMSIGYDASAAFGYAAGVHLVMYLVVTLLGIIFLYGLGHTFSSLSRALKRP
jgi:hypothetical protein